MSRRTSFCALCGSSKETAPPDVGPRAHQYGSGRVALLNAVAKVVARSGLRGLTYRAVAAEAGVSHGSVSLHFGSRDVMIAEAHAHAIAQGISRSSLEPGTGRIEQFVEGLAASVRENPEREIFQYELLLESRRRRDLAEETRRLFSAYTDAAARELERMGFAYDPALARFMSAALDGVVLHQAVGLQSEGETEAQIERLREMLAALLDARRTADPLTAQAAAEAEPGA